jgi:signal transduction histidine kinase
MTLNIFKKGLLVIAIPIVVQAVLIGMLIQTQFERDRALRWAVHTKEVIARVEAVYRRLLEGATAVRIELLSADTSVGDPFRHALDQVSQQIDELKRLVADNPPQQARLEQFAIESRTFTTWHAAQERRIQAGERGAAFDQLDQGVRILVKARSTLDAVLVLENELDRLRIERVARSAGRQRLVVLGGAAALLATNIWLAFMFLNGVIRGLTVIRDNTRRFAEGKGLHEPLTGNDEIVEVDRAFHEMATNLQEQRRENEMFVYSVSHDLRSPLINLQGFSEELSLSCSELGALFRHEDVPLPVRSQGLSLLNDNIDSSIRYIRIAVGRLARIIDGLLRLSRAGRVEYQWQPIDVAAMVYKIVDSLRDSISGKNAQVSAAALPPAWGDPTAVEQIFANLIGNALAYLDPERTGRIEVGSGEIPSPSAMAGFRTYYVQDNGLGIPEAYQDRVFTAFSRLHADVAQGEGIGLALVRRMVERHGGKIWMDSKAGVGTTFFVSLPDRAPGATQPDADNPSLTQIQRKGNLTWQPSRF